MGNELETEEKKYESNQLNYFQNFVFSKTFEFNDINSDKISQGTIFILVNTLLNNMFRAFKKWCMTFSDVVYQTMF